MYVYVIVILTVYDVSWMCTCKNEAWNY